MADLAQIGIEHKIPFGGRWWTFIEANKALHIRQTDGALEKLDGETEEMVREQLRRYNLNRLSFFLPHGMPWRAKKTLVGGIVEIPASCYPQEMDNDGRGFLNDTTSDVCLLVSPSKVGKSYVGAAWIAFQTIECDPEWECFREHGVLFRPWTGPKMVKIFSFSWENVADLWRRYRELLPRDELGPYAPNWGKLPGEQGKAQTLNFKDGRAKSVEMQKSGSTFEFNCYSQGEAATEGYEADLAHFDEQSDKKTWFGFLRGTQTRGDFTPCCHTLTGRALEDRSDTGMAGWVYQELWTGENTYGRSVSRYCLSMDSVPDEIVSAKKKKQAYDTWANPSIKRSEKDRRAGIARYWGGWEPGGGLVIGNFSPVAHVIPPYDRTHKVVKRATHYRGMDHGLGRPCTCAWADVFPWGHIVIHREFYEAEKRIPYCARAIVEASGNTRRLVSVGEDEENETSFEIYEEVFNTESYAASVLDSRSFASPAQERNATIGQLYLDHGLFCTPSKGWQNDRLLPLMLPKFDIIPHEKHIMWWFRRYHVVDDEAYEKWLEMRDGDILNAPNIYFTSDLLWTFREIRAWAFDGKTGKIKSENDHLIGGAIKYLMAERPVYWGRPLDEKDDQQYSEEDNEPSRYKYVRY